MLKVIKLLKNLPLLSEAKAGEGLNTVEQTGTGTIITKTKYLSCDKRQYDAIIEHFAEQGIKPIVNTYKPIF